MPWHADLHKMSNQLLKGFSVQRAYEIKHSALFFVFLLFLLSDNVTILFLQHFVTLLTWMDV